MERYQKALNRAYEIISDLDFKSQLECAEQFKTLQEAVDKANKYNEKETPLTVNYIADGYADGYPVYDTATCPNCDRIFEVYDEEHYKYCPNCGQKLNWSDEVCQQK